jgi:hypothetical protein
MSPRTTICKVVYLLGRDPAESLIERDQAELSPRPEAISAGAPAGELALGSVDVFSITWSAES